MRQPPRPVRTLTLAEIQATVLKAGSSILVESDDGEALLGVLTRDEGLIGEAEIAQLIEDGHVPTLEKLLARDDRGELP
jgi:hypothetical protein